ncbi:hypothetical protein R1flu_010448 [Riccia fluitans]|uniref:O-fucosyltransferase family protein n=1 Tax=Riccia fluitans TaxID=41844 RepID=A0ABD1Z504_9MARC
MTRPNSCCQQLQKKILPPRNLTAEVSTKKAESVSIYLLDGDLSQEKPTIVDEKFIWPLLSEYVGAGNQVMEFMAAAIVARALNRTLCLSPFRDGPSRHFGLVWRNGHGLAIEDRYNVEELKKFVKVAPAEHCLQTCNRKLDASWFLRAQRSPSFPHWEKNSTDKAMYEAMNLKWSFISWTTMEDIKNGFGESNLSCVALGGLFPGVRWRGAYLALNAYLPTSDSLRQAATIYQMKTFGLDRKFIALHWRFEETLCGRRQLGTCFLRCGDGAIVATRLRVEAPEWREHEKKMRECSFHGVRVTVEDMVAALHDKATEMGADAVYIATDGWVRGKEGKFLVKQVVEKLREKGMMVVGMWHIEELPNFPDGTMIPTDPQKLAELYGITAADQKISSRFISGVEQEICARSEAFLGTGQSTWSLAVFRQRLAQRKARKLVRTLVDDLSEEEFRALDQSIHDQVIAELLKDDHEAELLCGYQRELNRFKVNSTAETREEEAPDGWIDLEACEMRVGKGGSCEFGTCD